MIELFIVINNKGSFLGIYRDKTKAFEKAGPYDTVEIWQENDNGGFDYVRRCY